MAEYRIAGRLEVAGAQAAAAELRKVADGFKKLGQQGKQSLADLEGRGRIDALFANIGKQSTVAAAQVKQSAAVMAGSIEKVSVASALASRSFAGLAGALTLGGAVTAVRGLVNGMDALNDAADATGASINKLAGLEKIAKNNASNLDQVTAALVKLNQALNAAPDSAQARALEAIGLDAAKLRELDPADALLEVSRAFAKFADDGNKARQMQELLGKSSRELAPIIRDLSTTSGDYSINAEKAALEAERFNKALGRAQGTIVGAGRDALTPLLEGFNNLADAIGKASSALEPLNRAIDRLTGGQAGRGQIPLVPPSIRALLDQFGGGSNGTVVSPTVRNLLSGRQLAPGVAAAAGDGRPSLPSPAALEAAAEAAKKLDAARTKAAEAAKRQAEAEAKLRERIAAQIADERAVLALVTQGIELDKARETVQLRRQGLTEAEIGQLQSLKGALAEITAEQKAATEAAKAEEQAREELVESIARQRQSAADAAADLQGQVREQLLQNEAFGATGVALALLTERRNLDRAAEIERFAEIVRATDPALADAYLAQAAALRELADARIAGAVQQEDADRAAEVIKRQQEEAAELGKVFDQVGQSLSNSLQQAFTQGGSFLKNFIRNIKAAFLNLVVRFAVQPVLTSVVGSLAGAFGFSGAANAAGTAGSLLNAASGLSNFGSIFGNGLTGAVSNGLSSLSGTLFNSGFTGASSLLDGLNKGLNIGSSFITSGIGSLATSLGGSLSAAGFATAANFVNGFGAGLTGGFSAIGGTSGAFSVGGALGAAAPFIGGALAIASIFGAFESKPKSISQTVTSNAAGGLLNTEATGREGGIPAATTALEGINREFTKQFGRLLTSLDQNLDQFKVIAQVNLSGGREKVAGGLAVQVGDQFAGTGLFAGSGTGRTKTGLEQAFQFKGSVADGLKILASPEEFSRTMRDALLAFGDFGDEVKKFLEALPDEGDLTPQLNALIALKDANRKLEQQLGLTTEEVVALANASGGDLAAKLAQLGSILDQTLTLDDLTEQANRLAGQFADLGVVMPTSVEQFQAVVRGIDQSSESGRALTNSLLDLIPAFAAVQQANAALLAQANERVAAAAFAVGQVFGEILAAREQARQTLEQLVQEQVAAIQDTATAFDDVIESLRDFRDELTLIAADTGPFGLAVRRAEFQSVANRARLGDIESAERLPEVGRGLLVVAAEQSATREDFLRELALVRQAADDAEVVAVRQKSIAEQQLDALKAQFSSIVNIDDQTLTIQQALQNFQTADAAATAATAQLTALGLINNSVLSLGDQLAAAIGELNTALANQAAVRQAVAAASEASAAAAQAELDRQAQAERDRIAAEQLAAQVAAGRTAVDALKGLDTKEVNKLSDATVLKLADAITAADITSKQFDDGKVNNKSVNLKDAQLRAGLQVALGVAADEIAKISSGDLKTIALASGLSESEIGRAAGLPGFATGGAFTNGIVSRPTAFNMGVMGEAGSEAIMPLANIGGSLGVRAQTDPAMLNELRALRQEVAQLRESNERAMFTVAKNTGKTAALLTDWDDGGAVNIRTEAAA